MILAAAEVGGGDDGGGDGIPLTSRVRLIYDYLNVLAVGKTNIARKKKKTDNLAVRPNNAAGQTCLSASSEMRNACVWSV